MNSFVRVVCAAVVTLSAACTADFATQPIGPGIPMVRLRAEPYSFAFYSGLDKQARLVVRDDATWQALWSQINFRSSPVAPRPAIDFSREMLVVVALGARGTGGYSILLEGAAEDGPDGTAIMVRSVSPGPNCVTTQAFTQPVDIARLPLRNGDVRFVEQTLVICQ